MSHWLQFSSHPFWSRWESLEMTSIKMINGIPSMTSIPFYWSQDRDRESPRTVTEDPRLSEFNSQPPMMSAIITSLEHSSMDDIDMALDQKVTTSFSERVHSQYHFSLLRPMEVILKLRLLFIPVSLHWSNELAGLQWKRGWGWICSSSSVKLPKANNNGICNSVCQMNH